MLSFGLVRCCLSIFDAEAVSQSSFRRWTSTVVFLTTSVKWQLKKKFLKYMSQKVMQASSAFTDDLDIFWSALGVKCLTPCNSCVPFPKMELQVTTSWHFILIKDITTVKSCFPSTVCSTYIFEWELDLTSSFVTQFRELKVVVNYSIGRMPSVWELISQPV